jgi:hypothetical protein
MVLGYWGLGLLGFNLCSLDIKEGLGAAVDRWWWRVAWR